MVLRKRAPPHLSSLIQANARSEPRSPVSPISPTSKSVSAPSPKRLTRPRRAKSSPHPRRIPSQDSIYSPDLNTSPAFDLMPLEQAQRSPVGAPSDTPNPWADDRVERPDTNNYALEQTTPPATASQPQPSIDGTGRKGDRVPSIVVAGTQRRMAANEWQEFDNRESWEPSIQLQSNNPFLKARQAEDNPWDSNSRRASHGDGSSDKLSQSEGYIPMTARLSLLDQTGTDPWAEEHPGPATQFSTWQDGQMNSQRIASTGQASHENDSAPPHVSSIFDGYDNSAQYPPQIDRRGLAPGSGINTYITDSTMATQSSHDLIDFDEPSQASTGATSLLQASSGHTPFSGDTHASGASQNISTGSAPPLPQRTNPSESLPGQPAAVPSRDTHLAEEEELRQKEQRSETYSIRHINWTDQAGKSRESPVLVQNKNGPCPLLALVNTLVLADQDTQSPIVRALQTKEQISLGLLIEALFDELTTRVGPDGELPDIEALSRFLTMLHTGMNVNPRLTLESNDTLGTFLETSDIRLYSTFGVPLVHGWITTPASEEDTALKRLAQYYEDIQLLPFRKQELEDRVFQGKTLTWEEEQAMKDIQAIERFTDIENATQLSTFGLNHLTERMPPGSFAILFRNDHFSTLYKHPQRQQLFTLVTDAGYSSHAKVVWECLVDVNGSNAEFFAGDFSPVGHAPPETSGPPVPRTSGNRVNDLSTPSERQSGTLSPQEQADADYAYALSLQYQEEERQEREGNNPRNHRASAPPGTSWGPDSSLRHSASVANGGSGRYTPGHRSSRLNQPPGRYSQSHSENVRHTGSHAGDVPPPAYEQAATNPAHSPRDTPEGRYQRNHFGRRVPPGPVPSGLADRPKDRSKDCVVM